MRSNYQVLNEINGLLILQPEECENLPHSLVNYNPTHDLCVANKHHKQKAEKTYKVQNSVLNVFITTHLYITRNHSHV